MDMGTFEVTYDPSGGPITLRVSSGFATQGTVYVFQHGVPIGQGALDVDVPIPDYSDVNTVGTYAPAAGHTEITVYYAMLQNGVSLKINPDPTIRDTSAGAAKTYEHKFVFV